jgi:flagellar biosynthesis protein
MSGLTGPSAKPRIAVALLYEDPSAPRVVASGQGWVGDKIIETAREHGIPIEEDPVLAQALSTLDIDEEIPEALYRAVAEVLGFLLKR